MNLAFIYDGLLEEMRVRGGHDWGKNLTTAKDRSNCAGGGEGKK
jgi:hypothetical protein